MANKEEIDTIAIIQKEIRIAKNNGKKVTEHLSGGRKQYKTAINSIITVGSLSFVVSFLTILVASLNLFLNYYNYDISPSTNSLILYGCEMLVSILTMILGWKLSRLNVTPRFVITSLIIILISNSLLFFGILPLLTAVFSIVGLVCWGTYKNWFYDIDTSGNSTEETEGYN